MTQFLLGVMEITLTLSAVIALLLLLSKLFGQKFSAKCRYFVWFIVAVRLCVPFGTAFLPSLIKVELPAEVTQSITETNPVTNPVNDRPAGTAPVQNSPVTVAPNVQHNTAETQAPTVPESPDKSIEMPSVETILTVCGYVWLAGAVVYLIISLARYGFSMHGLRKTLTPASDETVKLYEKLYKKQNIRRAPAIYVSTLVSSPMLYGYFKPRIILPKIELTPNSLVGILSHELTHYRRRDLWVKLLCVLATSLHWLNPLVHIAAKRCNNEMELSCDESVLSGLDGDARLSYGNVMLEIIKRCRKQSGTLTTQFNPKKSAVRERFDNILDMTKKKRGLWIIAVVAAVCVIAGMVIGCSIGSPNADDSSDNQTIIERSGMYIPIPSEYADRLYIPDEPTREWNTDSVIVEIYEKQSYDEYLNDYGSTSGLLFGILRYDTAQYERYLSSDGSGLNFFAKDDKYYYGVFTSTSVEFYRSGITSYSEDVFAPWNELVELKNVIIEEFITHNTLTNYNDSEFRSREYTYDGDHVSVFYYPYYTTSGSRDEKYILVLSQPVKQGADGIWCVERWHDEADNLYYYFPSASETELPASEYYAELQAQCDAEHRPELLDPIQVSLEFATEFFVHTPTTDSFEIDSDTLD